MSVSAIGHYLTDRDIGEAKDFEMAQKQRNSGNEWFHEDSSSD